ncbi:MAG: hypothetical protein AAFO62_11645 [Pseudomonadota bacterium]
MLRVLQSWPGLAVLTAFLSFALVGPATAQTASSASKTTASKAKPKAKAKAKAKSKKTAAKKTAKTRKAKKKTARSSPCQGLARSACSGKSACLWVQRKKNVDKNGRKLSSYCRKRAARTAKALTN